MLTSSTPFGLSKDGLILFSILLIAIFEGALIKWFGFPSSILLFIRDCLALMLTYRAVKLSVFPKSSVLVSALLIWTFLLICYGLVQAIINQSNPLLYLIGLRFNIVYLWMAVSAAHLLKKNDFLIILRWLLFICIILSPLVIAQSYLPTDHLLNTQPETDAADIFVSSGGYVRTTGTFTFTLGFTCFLVLLTPFALSNTWQGSLLIKEKWISALATICIVSMTAVSGSRGAISWLVILVIINIIFTLLITKKITIQNIFVLGLLFLGALLAFFFLDGQLDAMQTRFIEANDQEVLSQRIWAIFFGEPHVMGEFTLLGYGIGTGSNAASVISGGYRDFALAESEPGRNLLELGVLGFIYIILKWFVSGVYIIRSMQVLNISNDGLPMMLWFSVSYAFLTWAVSGQLSANVIAYILLAFALASLNRVDD